MNLIPLSTLLGDRFVVRIGEGARKRRTAYRSGRRELIGFDIPRDIVPKPKRKKPKEKLGRLIKRTPYASKQRWRIY